MAQISKSIDKMLALEFSSPDVALHKNKTENDLTYMGIYRVAHPNWEGWNKIDMYLDQYDSPKAAGHEAYYDEKLKELVMQFYKEEFWDKMRLDDITSQRIAEDIFVFGVNAGVKRAIELAQYLVGTQPDGVIGSKTVTALNNYDEEEFDTRFDGLEKEYYEKLVKKNIKFSIYLKGWRNRADAV